MYAHFCVCVCVYADVRIYLYVGVFPTKMKHLCVDTQ